MKLESTRIGVIGLGYVGLPLALEFSKHFRVVGFDIDSKRINDLKNSKDITNEVEQSSLKKAKNILYSSDVQSLETCNFYIITVPTPIDKNKKPNLRPLKQASNLVAPFICKGDVIVYFFKPSFILFIIFFLLMKDFIF